jgi:7-cyano-7-deazaguanine synthase in queuosine biosynthesis
VVILFSGGLDSVMLAMLLKRQGHRPQPVYMSHRANVGNVTKKELKAASKLARSILGKKLIIVKAPAKGKEPSWYNQYGDVLFSQRLPVPKERKDQRNRIFLKVLRDLDLADGLVALGLFDSEATPKNRKRWADIRTPDLERSFDKLKTGGKLVTLTSLGYEDKAAALQALGRRGKIPAQLWSSESCLMYFNKPCGDCASCKARAEAFLAAWGEDKTPYRPKSVAGRMKRKGRANRAGRRALSIIVQERPPSDAFIREMKRDEGWGSIAYDIEEWEPGDSRLWTASIQGEDVGVAQGDVAWFDDNTHFRISDIFVLPLARRQGVNNALVDAVVSSTPLPVALSAAAPHMDAQVAALLRRGWEPLTLAKAKALGSIDLEERLLSSALPQLIFVQPAGRANRSLRSRAGQVRKEAEGVWRKIGPQARHPDYRSKKKPAAGRCYQTALWMRDKFKSHGKVVLVQGAEGSCKKHYWLRVGGVDVDITGDQYGHPKVQVGSLPYEGKVRSWPKSRAPSGHPGAMMRAQANRSALRAYHLSPLRFGEFRQQVRPARRKTDAGFHFGSKETALSVGDKLRREKRVRPSDPLYLYEVELRARNPLRLIENRLGSWTVDDMVGAIFDLDPLPARVTEEDLDAYWQDEVISPSGENIKNIDNAQEQIAEFVDWLGARGYDSVQYENNFEGGGLSTIVFRPEQIRVVGVSPWRNAPKGRQNKRFFGVTSPAQGLKVIKHPDITANWEKSLRWKPTEKTAVLLPCAATKPFPDAPSHKAGYLDAVGNKKVDLFVVSEPLGIVPYSWSRKWPNNAYDFPPEHLQGAAFDLLAERMGKWFDRVGKKYDKIYLALPRHHARLIKTAIGDRKVPTVDVGIGACLKAKKCATGEYRSTTHAYRGFLKGRLRT